MKTTYPVTFSIDFPDRDLDRVSTAFRILAVIPIGIILSLLTGASVRYVTTTNGTNETVSSVATGGGLLFPPLVLMILFRQKYPRWWFDWNLQLLRFSNRVTAYLGLLDDHYPSTDEEQAVHLVCRLLLAKKLNRWLPLVKGLLAIPPYIFLFFLVIGAVVAVIVAWFAILFTGRYPRGLFDYVVGVIRWSNRVTGYAMVLVTDEYPPFSLE